MKQPNPPGVWVDDIGHLPAGPVGQQVPKRLKASKTSINITHTVPIQLSLSVICMHECACNDFWYSMWQAEDSFFERKRSMENLAFSKFLQNESS